MPAVIYDLFPAAVLVTPRDPETNEMLTDHTFEIGSARVVVTEDRALVAIDSPTGPVMVMDVPYTPGNFTKASSMYKDSTVTASTGQTLVFKKDDSCGCGSRLRSWNPYSTIVARG